MSNTIPQQQPFNMQIDPTAQPLFLPVGTEVSAKFKGAFCEARVKKMIKSVRVKVQLKDSDNGSITLEESAISAPKIEVGQTCEIQQPGKPAQKGQILSIKDCSTYTVIFNDLDEKVLKRSQLCPKSGRHFKDHETLDKLPLNNPEKMHYKKRKHHAKIGSQMTISGEKSPEERQRRSASVISPLKKIEGSRSATRRIAQIHEESMRCASAADCPNSSPIDPAELDIDSNSSDISTPDPEEPSTSAAASSMPKQPDAKKSLIEGLDKLDSSEPDAMEEPIKQQQTSQYPNDSLKFPPGSVVIVNELINKANQHGKIKLGMVVPMEEYRQQCKTTIQIIERGIPIRYFHNGRYHIVPSDCINFFDQHKSDLIDSGSSGLKQAFQHANRYITKGELPASWQKKVQPASLSSTDTDGSKMKEKPEAEDIIKKKSKIPLKIKKKPNKLEGDKKEVKNLKKKEEVKLQRGQNEMNLPKEPSQSIVVDQTKQPIEKESKKKAESKQSRQTPSSAISEHESSDGSDLEEEEDASEEKKSNLVAHFYKFQEESGNEQNLTPNYAGKDIDIYSFYNAVNKMGGHKQVTQKNKWGRVLRKLKLEQAGVQCDAAEIRETYLLYFEKFEAFMKNLGDSAVASFASSSGSQRNTRIVRTIATPSVVSAVAQADKKRTKEQKASSTEKSLAGGSTKSRSRSGSVKDPSPAISIKSSTAQEELLPESSSTSTGSGRQKFAHERRLSFSSDGNLVNVVIKTEKSPPKDCAINAKSVQKSAATSTGSEHQKSQSNSLPSSKTNFSTDPQKSTSTSSETSTVKVKSESSDKEENLCSTSSSTSAGKLNLLKKRISSHEALSQEYVTKKATHKVPGQRGRKPKAHREDRVKSPSGHKAVLEDIGYSNAHIFSRFFQGQNVHARHHLRFYDARVITVKQPSLTDIANSLRNAFELSRITHQGSPDLQNITIENMGPELRDALRNLMNSTKIFVHYLGWNSRYDEWLMLHKIRVDEKDERASSKQLEQLIPKQLSPALVTVALDWCASPDGISSLAALPSAQSLEQRPRRLSSSALAKTQHSHGSTDSASLLPRKHSNTAMGYRSPLNPSAQHHPSSSSSYTGISQSLSKFTIPHLPPPAIAAPVVVKEECPETTTAESISTLNSQTSSTALICSNESQMPPHKQLIDVPSSQPQSQSNTFGVVKTEVEPLQQNRSDTESPFQLPPPPAPPVLTPTKLLEQQQHFLASADEIGTGNEANLHIHFHQNEAAAGVEYAINDNAATKCAFTLNATELLPADSSQEMASLKIPVKEEHSRADSPALLSINKKRKNASGEMAGAMSPPSKFPRQGIKSPARHGHALAGRSPMRPNETSDEEDNSFEGNQVESMHSLRQRVLNRLEAENAFDNDDYLGLPNLDEMLAECADDPDKQISLIEGRMRELHSIYHESKSRLAELDRQDRQHRKSVAARKVQTAAPRGKPTTDDEKL